MQRPTRISYSYHVRMPWRRRLAPCPGPSTISTEIPLCTAPRPTMDHKLVLERILAQIERRHTARIIRRHVRHRMPVIVGRAQAAIHRRSDVTGSLGHVCAPTIALRYPELLGMPAFLAPGRIWDAV